MRELSSELVEKYTNECEIVGFKYLGRGNKKGYSLAECSTFGHVDTYVQSDIRKGKVRCSNCLVNKYKSFVKHGWEYVDKIAIKRNTKIILKHDCSCNLITVNLSGFLKCSYDCPHCSKTHYDDHSYFYVIKVTHSNQTIIKIGVANDTDRRFGKYGLPDDSTLEIVHIEPFPSKRFAIKFESMAKQALKDYKIQENSAKAIFRDSGFTECFTEDSLEVIEQLL